jgi:PEP-CTERM motif
MTTKAMLLLAMLLTASASAEATTYTVEYFIRGPVSQQTRFYGEGAYAFLLTPDYVTTYRHQPGILYHGDGTTTIAVIWVFIGMYGAPYGGYPAAVLPEDFPVIAFSGAYDQAVVVPWVDAPAPQGASQAVPEPGTLTLTIAALGLLAAMIRTRERHRNENKRPRAAGTRRAGGGVGEVTDEGERDGQREATR